MPFMDQNKAKMSMKRNGNTNQLLVNDRCNFSVIGTLRGHGVHIISVVSRLTGIHLYFFYFLN